MCVATGSGLPIWQPTVWLSSVDSSDHDAGVSCRRIGPPWKRVARRALDLLEQELAP